MRLSHEVLVLERGFELSVVKPKPKQLLTSKTTQPISNRRKTKVTSSQFIKVMLGKSFPSVSEPGAHE